MAISTDALIEFFGTQDTVTGTVSAVTDGSFSVAGDVSTWTNDDDAPSAVFVFVPDYSVAPTAGRYVDLYAKLENSDGTADTDEPTNDLPYWYMGAFPLAANTNNDAIAIRCPLPNTKSSQEYIFYIKNNAGQSLSTGWTLKVTPFTVGPHA